MTTIKATFVFDSETKGAVKYRERIAGSPGHSEVLAQYPNSFGAKVGILYVRKSAFVNAYPMELTLTIEEK